MVGVKSVVNKKALHLAPKNRRDSFRKLDGLDFEFVETE